MKKLLKTFLLAVCLLVGTNSAWATTETFGSSKSSTKDYAIEGTAVNIAGTSNPGGTGSYAVFGVSGEKGLKLRTGSALTFNVNIGYRITNITIKAYQNNTSSQTHNMTCGGFSVDGTTYNFDSAKEIPYDKESTSTDPVVISTGKISATSSVAFNFTNTSTYQNQIFAYVTVEYEAANFIEDFTAKGESTDPTDYGFSLTYGSGSSSSLVNFSVTDGILQCVAGPYANKNDGNRTGTATATFDEIGSGNVILLNYKWALGNATGNSSGSYTKTRIGNSSGNALELSFYGSNNNGTLKVNGTDVKTGNSSIRNTTYNISAKLDMNTRKITALTMTCSNASFSYSISEPIDFASAITSIDRFAFENSERQSWSNTSSIDDIILFKLVYPTFTLSDTEKEFYVEDSETVTLTSITGDISVKSDDTDVATVSYSDGTVTINGVAAGTTTVKVTGKNDGLTITKNIDVTINGFAAKYTAAKAPYDTKVESLDTDGQAYWTANVTDPATVTTSETYATAVAALPATYIAAVKAQGAGSDMTDAMPTGNAGWTCSQGNGPATVKETFTETYGAESAFVEGNIMSQTITGLQNGYYKVQFYGVVNAARSPSALTVNTDGLAQAYANSTNEEITVYYQDDCTPSDYLHTIEAQVTDGTLTYGLKAKTGVTDAGNWAVAKIFKLTFLGDTKYNYTINAVAGETTIKQLGTGSEYPGLDYGAYVPYVIQYNSKYYVLDDNSTYYKNFTMGATNETKEVSYTLDESIVGYTEGEGSSYRYVVGSNNAAYSSGDYINNKANNGLNKRNRGFDLGTLPSGIYQMVAYVVNSANGRSVALRNVESETTASEPIILITNSGKITGELKKNFRLEESTKLRVNGANSGTDKNNQMEEIDYVLIRKLNVNDDPVIIGEIDNSTYYLTDMTDKVTLKPGESYRYQFVNHNSNGSDNTKNWVLPVYDSNDTKTIVVRADNWEDEAKANSGCTNNFNWTNFISKMDGATVDMTVSFTTDKKFTMSADIVTSTNDNWTYSYTSDYSGTAIDFTGDDYIKVALSVSLSWLEVLSEGYSTVAPTISAVNYGTYSSDYALDFEHATGIQAYYSKATAGGKIIMTKVNTAVAAREGLFIEKVDGDISIPVVDSGATLTGNKLKAGGVEAPANSYVFAKQDNVLGFYRLTSATNIPKGKAYLEAGTYGARLTIMFDDETTGISELKQAEQMNLNETVYNLRGQRVAQPQKGLFIVNGHKVVVK